MRIKMLEKRWARRNARLGRVLSGVQRFVKNLVKPIYDATQYKHFSGETKPLKVIFLHPFRP
jgi:hypothetical protein